MTEMADGTLADEMPPPREIDPFDYFPARQSRIGGLGGHESFSDPSYAFHTHYQPCTPGPLTFKVSIRNLVATYGTLVLRVNVIPLDLRFDPKLAKTAPVPLPQLAESGGEISIEVIAKEGMLYALLGHVYEDTDADASAITVTVQQAANHGLSAGDLQGNEETRYRASSTGGAPHLISGNPASLVKPVSQSCTPAQFGEAPYARWATLVEQDGDRRERVWPKVYILQALKVYGMLEGGARGLGFGDMGGGTLPATMALEGCSIVALHAPTEEEALDRDFADQRICDRELLDQHVTARPAPFGEIPGDLGRFDFLWSHMLFDRFASLPDVKAFLERSLDCLNLGGVAVHTFTLGLTSNTGQADFTNGLIIPRDIVERAAVSLISHGHEVSQIRYDRAALKPPRWGRNRALPTAVRDGIEIVPFGLIVRKGNA